MMLQPLLVHPVRFRANFSRFRRRQKLPDYRKSFGIEFRGEILHDYQRIMPLYACQVACPNSGAMKSRPASSVA